MNVENKIVLVKRIDHVLNSHEVEEIGLKARNIYSTSAGQFLVRICTNNSFVRAIPFAKTPINNVRNALKLGNIPDEHIFFSNSDKCGDDFNSNVEIWWTSSKENFPLDNESFTSCQVKEFLTFPNTLNDYHKFLIELRKKLNSSDSKNKALTVVGVFIKKPSNQLLKRLNFAKSILKNEIKNGLAKVDKTKISGTSDIYYLEENNFPQILYVEVLPKCNK